MWALALPTAMGAGDREQPSQPTDYAPPGRLGRATASNRSLLAQSSLTLISRTFAKSVQILFLIVAARLLTVEEFASYSYMLVLAFVVATVSDTGVPIVASRDISAGRALPGDIYAAAMPVVVLAAVVAAAFLPLITVVDSGPGSTVTAGLLIAAFVVFNRVFEFQAASLRGVGQFGGEAAIQAGGAALFIAAATAVTVAGLGVVAVLAVLCAKELASAGAAYLLLRPDLRRSPGPPPVRWPELLKLGIRLSLAGIALVLVMRLPLVALGNSGSAEEVALFSAAQRFADAAFVLATASGTALLPGIAYLARSDPPRARALLRRVLLVAAAVSAMLAALAFPLAETAMRIIFGPDFDDGAKLLRIILAGLPAYVVLGICWYTIVAFHGERRLLGVSLAGLAVASFAVLLLVPGGDDGAAWSYVIALYAMAGLTLGAVARQLGGPAYGATRANAHFHLTASGAGAAARPSCIASSGLSLGSRA